MTIIKPTQCNVLPLTQTARKPQQTKVSWMLLLYKRQPCMINPIFYEQNCWQFSNVQTAAGTRNESGVERAIIFLHVVQLTPLVAP